MVSSVSGIFFSSAEDGTEVFTRNPYKVLPVKAAGPKCFNRYSSIIPLVVLICDRQNQCWANILYFFKNLTIFLSALKFIHLKCKIYILFFWEFYLIEKYISDIYLIDYLSEKNICIFYIFLLLYILTIFYIALIFFYYFFIAYFMLLIFTIFISIYL